MIYQVRKILDENHINTLSLLAKKSDISLNKIKNISCGRTSFNSLFIEKKRNRILPEHSAALAELIGIVLGDGNIFRSARCQRLNISCNSKYKNYITYVSYLIGQIFRKTPSIIKRTGANCCDVRLYMQDIDKTLSLPAGNKIQQSVRIPRWVFCKKEYLIKCMKGLFETDGHYGLSRKFNVEYFQFCNKSKSLLKSVFLGLRSLGYTPQFGSNYIRLAKRKEIGLFIRQMHFIRPFPALSN